MATYDPFAYEVSAWDVPIWNLSTGCFQKQKPKVRKVEYCKLNELKQPAALSSSPGEFDLLDARSLMERGDFTGAIRRTVTAVETLVDEKVNAIIRKKETEPRAEKAINKLRYDWDAKFQMLRDELKIDISGTLVEAFHHTQQVRNDIVHRAIRLAPADRDRAQHMIDTSRWLFNPVEAMPARAKLRDTGLPKTMLSAALTFRFGIRSDKEGITVVSR